MGIEYNILMFIRNNISSPIMDKIMIFVTKFGDAGIFWSVLALLLLIPKKTRKTGFLMVISLVLGLLFGNIIIKNLVGRTRPFVVFNQPIIIPPPSEYSFPSGHTLCSFESALCLFTLNKYVGIVATVFASLIAFSRLYLFVHYPTDIIGGIVLAFFTVFLAKRIILVTEKKKGIAH